MQDHQQRQTDTFIVDTNYPIGKSKSNIDANTCVVRPYMCMCVSVCVVLACVKDGVSACVSVCEHGALNQIGIKYTALFVSRQLSGGLIVTGCKKLPAKTWRKIGKKTNNNRDNLPNYQA